MLTSAVTASPAHSCTLSCRMWLCMIVLAFRCMYSHAHWLQVAKVEIIFALKAFKLTPLLCFCCMLNPRLRIRLAFEDCGYCIVGCPGRSLERVQRHEDNRPGSCMQSSTDMTCACCRSEFVFNNPNSKGSCGCGESFTT